MSKNKIKKQNPPEFENILEVEGIGAQGYGNTYKLLMKDRRLSIESKAIYNYFSSYAGAGRTAFPSVSLICADLGISKSRYYKHFKPLVDLGYISTFQMKEGYTFGRNVYILHSNPKPVQVQEGLACTQNKDTTQSQEELTCTQNKDTTCTQNEDTQNEDTQNEDTQNEESKKNSVNNNSFKKNSFNSINNKRTGKTEAYAIPNDFYYDWMNDLD